MAGKAGRADAESPDAMTRSIAPAALWALLAMLAACAPQRSTMSAVETGMIRPSAAYILPDPGGPVVIGAIQRNLGTAIEHEVLLGVPTSTSGQNALTVQVYGRAHRSGDGALASDAPTDASVTREMEDVLAGVPMQVSPYFVQNRYGPFGYAIGRGRGRDICIYGWQKLQTESGNGPFYSNRFLLQIRLRLCQSGATESDLLWVMYNFTLSAQFGSQYPDMPRTAAPNVIGLLGTPAEVRPANPTGLAYVLPREAPAPAAPARAVASAPAAPRAPAAPPAAATSSARAVPTPFAGSPATATAPRPVSGGPAPVVPPPDLTALGSPSQDGPADPLSPAMQAITAAREIELPNTLAREADE
jgi:Cellulose biosynthesis protein BcsN